MSTSRSNSDPDLFDRFEFVTDPDAEPVNLDEAVAELLLALVEARDGESSGTG